jgi:hypothetical protein
MADKNKGGRPPMFKSANEMQVIIDKYFKDCEGEILTNRETGETVYDKYGQPVWIHVKPPTITGLALTLGFNSRQTLLNYQDKEEFLDTITRAKARVEEYAESRLFDKDGANGAKFSLANNFKNWADKQELDLGNKDGKPFEVRNMSDAEIEAKLAELGYSRQSKTE